MRPNSNIYSMKDMVEVEEDVEDFIEMMKEDEEYDS